jgi:hypothetical protein
MTFQDDVAFLKKHVDVHVLGGKTGPAVAVVAGYQCRVMTSTADAAKGNGAGWINYELIQSGKTVPHINVFGGEDRFWLGPEGGQFSVFFKNGDPFDLPHWQTPALIDTEPFEVVSASSKAISCRRVGALENYMGTKFNFQVDRTVKLLSASEMSKYLGTKVPAGLSGVGYESKNTLANTGNAAWTKDSGMLSIWILGMYKPSPKTTVAIPYKEGDYGQIVNDVYFGKVPADRLQTKNGVAYFKGDGQHRSKIGIGPKRAVERLGSWDAEAGMLTIVQYTLPKGRTDYVNSLWELQDKPFGGDVVNSYNDGPPAPGKKPLGPFYEIESSSPAANLAPGGSITHYHRTFHFTGDRKALDALARATLGAGLKDIENAL